MVEMRWLVRPKLDYEGRPMPNHKEKVLQYRTWGAEHSIDTGVVYRYAGDYEWTEWRDVPVSED